MCLGSRTYAGGGFGTADALSISMERVDFSTGGLAGGHERSMEIEARVLRSRLVNLVLDWELAALTMDAQRYKSHEQCERESLRDSANTYRKCIAELNHVLTVGHSARACNAHVAP